MLLEFNQVHGYNCGNDIIVNGENCTIEAVKGTIVYRSTSTFIHEIEDIIAIHVGGNHSHQGYQTALDESLMKYNNNPCLLEEGVESFGGGGVFELICQISLVDPNPSNDPERLSTSYCLGCKISR